MIDDTKPVSIVEFVELKSKTYSLVKNNGVVVQNAKRINKVVVRKINHERFFGK